MKHFNVTVLLGAASTALASLWFLPYFSEQVSVIIGFGGILALFLGIAGIISYFSNPQQRRSKVGLGLSLAGIAIIAGLLFTWGLAD